MAEDYDYTKKVPKSYKKETKNLEEWGVWKPRHDAAEAALNPASEDSFDTPEPEGPSAEELAEQLQAAQKQASQAERRALIAERTALQAEQKASQRSWISSMFHEVPEIFSSDSQKRGEERRDAEDQRRLRLGQIDHELSSNDF